ncbi:MAG: pimeloyl-ACP methyl ester carboxylesterase [Cyclobacteriaceae bacterium]|jgi:pimeloyl-ACP methyl ester carboxylesterase
MNSQPLIINQNHILGRKKGMLVFIHGNSSSLKIFDHFFEQTNFDHGRIRFDLPGHGDSYRSENLDHYTFKHYIKVVLDIIKNIDDDILLVGNSMGGNLAMEVAPSIPKLKGIVIFGAPPVRKPINVEEAFNPFEYIQYMLSADVPTEMAQAMFSAAMVNQQVVPSVIKDFYRTDPNIRTVAAEEMARDPLSDEVSILDNLKAKKYFLNPLQDPTPNIDYIRSVAGDAEIIDIPECGHYPSLERPDEFNQILRRISGEVFG